MESCKGKEHMGEVCDRVYRTQKAHRVEGVWRLGERLYGGVGKSRGNHPGMGRHQGWEQLKPSPPGVHRYQRRKPERTVGERATEWDCGGRKRSSIHFNSTWSPQEGSTVHLPFHLLSVLPMS